MLAIVYNFSDIARRIDSQWTFCSSDTVVFFNWSIFQFESCFFLSVLELRLLAYCISISFPEMLFTLMFLVLCIICLSWTNMVTSTVWPMDAKDPHFVSKFLHKQASTCFQIWSQIPGKERTVSRNIRISVVQTQVDYCYVRNSNFSVYFLW